MCLFGATYEYIGTRIGLIFGYSADSDDICFDV